MLIVSHDLAPLRRLANRIIVLDEGCIVESQPMASLSQNASHPLLQSLSQRRLTDATA